MTSFTFDGVHKSVQAIIECTDCARLLNGGTELKKNILTSYILPIIGLVLALDILGFTMWALSGQFPAGSFFIGSITLHALRAIF